MLSVGNKGPESLKTEIHLITEELPSQYCPVFQVATIQHVLGMIQSQVNIRLTEGEDRGSLCCHLSVISKKI